MSLLTSTSGHGPGFRLAGIPIAFEWTFLLWTGVIALNLGDPILAVAWVVVVTVSILVHELGHAAALRRWGVGSRIVLHGLGGVTIPTRALDTRPRRIAVSLAGPFAGVALLGLPALLLDATMATPDPWDDILRLTVLVNLGYGLVNLLPMLPLDGGNVAYELLDAGTGGRGEVPARVLSILTGVAGGLWALSAGYVIAAVLAGFLVAENVRGLRSGRERSSADDLQKAVAALEAGDAAEALALSTEVVGRSRDRRVRALALEVGAWAGLAAGDPATARRTLAGHPAGVQPSGHLRAFLDTEDAAERVNLTVDAWLDQRFVPARAYVDQLDRAGLVEIVVDRLAASRADDAESARMGLQHALFLAGRFDSSARLGERMLDQGTTEPIVAFNTACAHARAGRVDASFAALDRAVALGFADTRLLTEDPDLAAVRSDPRFALLRNRLTGT